MKRKKKKRKKKAHQDNSSISWLGDDGVHAIVEGSPPTEAELAEMTRVYQAKIRKSPLYKIMVKIYGKEKAEEMVKECRVELRK